MVKTKLRKVLLLSLVFATLSLIFADPSFSDPANQLVKAGDAILNGPEVKQLKVNGHKFNCKQATIVRDSSGKTVKIAGQLSHCLRGRPDDQIYYTVNFVDGHPSSQDIKIERGGVASIVKIALDAITIGDSLSEIQIFGTKIKISPENFANIATQISKLTEGSGWEPQAGAIITYAAVIASQPQ